MSRRTVIGWLATAALGVAMAGCSSVSPAAASAAGDTEVRPALGDDVSGAGTVTQPDALDNPENGPASVTVTVARSDEGETLYEIVVLLNVGEEFGVSGVEVTAAAANGVNIVSVAAGSLLGADVVRGPRYVQPDGLASTIAYARAGESRKEALAGVAATFVVSLPDGTPAGDDLVLTVTFTDADFSMQPALVVSLPSE